MTLTKIDFCFLGVRFAMKFVACVLSVPKELDVRTIKLLVVTATTATLQQTEYKPELLFASVVASIGNADNAH